MRFRATIEGTGKTAAGTHVPTGVVAALSEAVVERVVRRVLHDG